ncbi:hypothetical protein SDRG_16163 [Saprolegnia diclina VS20]|uniref:Uncharacterized protein n=1 Tax=Saprolegnia diclina (strain VS20) TaxID=1156394 RepID=T0PUW6_SAPDV|nr:hypothetical protein SDRG_16163 [Saprolegnia diclina VS20]EQC26016.1 hypothetical protein SDRG_16163 [Saprolegnia diclina VS20]|eukprot:XP_008620584.1 hypothetical protein SDRG_16163 [Saprolegnia diclina VS20]
MLSIRRAVVARAPATFSAVTMPTRSFSDKWTEKEMAEEKRFFNKEDEKALRQLLAKMKGQVDGTDAAKAHEAAEKKHIAKILGSDVSADAVEKLLKWKHDQH